MTVVRKPSNRTVVRKGSVSESKKILSNKIPGTIEELGDTNFGELNASKDGMLVSYDAATDKFILITADNVFEESAADEDIPDVFIDQVEAEVDLGTIALDDLDGGSFT